MLLGIIFITITLHKRTQSIQKTSVKEIQQFSNEKVNFCSFLERRTRWRSEIDRNDFYRQKDVRKFISWMGFECGFLKSSIINNNLVCIKNFVYNL
jgi:hypothetical protein